MIKKIIINISVIVFLISNTSFADIKFWTTEVQPARMAKQEDMAKALNTYGLVSSLRRVGFGNLDKKLISLDYLLSLVHIECLLSILKPIEMVFNEFNQIHLDMNEFALILNGRPVEMNEIRNKINDFCGELTLAKFKNKLVAVGYLKDGNFYPKNLLNNFFV